MVITPYLNPLLEAFEAHADEENAVGMAKYLRNQFEFYGIKTPVRKTIQKEFFKTHGLPPIDAFDAISREMWALPQREWQYAAMGFVEKQKREWMPEHVTLFEHLIVTKSWWDTVDLLATHMVGGLFQRYPGVQAEVLPSWRASENIWLRRVAILFQLHYKTQTDVPLLFAIIEENLGSDEFFINKAIGWALREYSKRDAAVVTDFVARTPLHSLSAREALKWLARQKRK